MARYNVSGVVVTGSHGMFDPVDKLWKRVSDVSYATLVQPSYSSDYSSVTGASGVAGHSGSNTNSNDNKKNDSPRLWNVITRRHRMVLSGTNSQRVLAADYMEVDETPELLEESLAHLNRAQGAVSKHEKPEIWWNQNLQAMLGDAPRRLRGCFPKGVRVLTLAATFSEPYDSPESLDAAVPMAIEKVPVGSFLLAGWRQRRPI